MFRTEILKGALTPNQVKAGFRLRELDDHFIQMTWGDMIVGTYNATRVTIATLQHDADAWLIKVGG